MSYDDTPLYNTLDMERRGIIDDSDQTINGQNRLNDIRLEKIETFTYQSFIHLTIPEKLPSRDHRPRKQAANPTNHGTKITIKRHIK